MDHDGILASRRQLGERVDEFGRVQAIILGNRHGLSDPRRYIGLAIHLQQDSQ